MGFALILALIDYMSKVVSNKKNYQELLINNERIKKWKLNLTLFMKCRRSLRLLLM